MADPVDRFPNSQIIGANFLNVCEQEGSSWKGAVLARGRNCSHRAAPKLRFVEA